MSRQYSTADCQGLRCSHTAQPLFTGSAAQGKFSQIASHRTAKPRTLQRSSRPTLRIKFPSEVFGTRGRVSQPRVKSAAQPDRETIVAIKAIHSQLILQFYGVASRATFSFSSRGSKRKKASVSTSRRSWKLCPRARHPSERSCSFHNRPHSRSKTTEEELTCPSLKL